MFILQKEKIMTTMAPHILSEQQIRQMIYNQLAIAEILGPDNRYFAGEKFGHEPDDNEAGIHYAEQGALSFAQRFGFIRDTSYSLQQIHQKLTDLQIDSQVYEHLLSSDIS